MRGSGLSVWLSVLACVCQRSCIVNERIGWRGAEEEEAEEEEEEEEGKGACGVVWCGVLCCAQNTAVFVDVVTTSAR